MEQTITLRLGDCFQVMRTLEENSVRGAVLDPPYGISFMSKGWDDLSDAEGMQKWHEGWLREAYRVLKPGAPIKAFCATRTFHRLAAAMEDAGFEGVVFEAWVYGVGFPKSLNVSKALDKLAGAERASVKTPFAGNALMRMGGQNTRPWMEEALKKGFHERPGDEPASPEAKLWDGWGTALKPAWEPFVVGYKPQ